MNILELTLLIWSASLGAGLLGALSGLGGGVVYLVRHGAALPSYAVFHRELITTPVMRVVLALVGFAKQHDRTYVIVSLTVLALLLYSFFGGRL